MKKFLIFLRDKLQILPLGKLHFFTQLDAKYFKSWSGYGEDAILNGILRRYFFLTGESLNVSYLDVGAFKPKKSSNTFFLYRQGSSGTAVEPNLALKKLWRGTRPRDLFRGVACGNGEKSEFYQFGPSAESNSLSKRFSDEIANKQHLNYQSHKVDTETLTQIVTRHKEKFPGEFILDLDVEGLDFTVLKKFTFESNVRPILFMVEDFDETESGAMELAEFMKNKGYRLIGKSVITSVYIDERSNFHRRLRDSEY
jgi:FkbM family methyltransferase